MSERGGGAGDRLEVWLIRHGERADEVGGPVNYSQRTPWYDPPLTARGQEQAGAMALKLAKMIDGGLDALDEVAVSPMLRTLQTAAPLGIQGIRLCPMLAESAAAVVEYGGVRRMPNGDLGLGPPPPPLCKLEPLVTKMEMQRVIQEAGATFMVNKTGDQLDLLGYDLEGVARLMYFREKVDALYSDAKERGCTKVAWVTHRETFRILKRMDGTSLGRVPYCGIVRASRLDDKRWVAEEISWEK